MKIIPRLTSRPGIRPGRAVDALGISVPKMLEMVRVGDAYATISERIKEKKSLSRICHDQPERVEEMARLMCAKGRELFSATCNTDFFPSRKEQLLRAVEKVQFIGKKNKAVLRAFADTIRDVKTCSHGDFNTGNLILAALGASRETIVADFDATNRVYEADVRKYSRRVRFWGGKEEEVNVVKSFMGANTENFVKTLEQVDRLYGSMEAYLKGPIGLTDADIQTLRQRYLE